MPIHSLLLLSRLLNCCLQHWSYLLGSSQATCFNTLSDVSVKMPGNLRESMCPSYSCERPRGLPRWACELDWATYAFSVYSTDARLQGLSRCWWVRNRLVSLIVSHADWCSCQIFLGQKSPSRYDSLNFAAMRLISTWMRSLVTWPAE